MQLFSKWNKNPSYHLETDFGRSQVLGRSSLLTHMHVHQLNQISRPNEDEIYLTYITCIQHPICWNLQSSVSLCSWFSHSRQIVNTMLQSAPIMQHFNRKQCEDCQYIYIHDLREIRKFKQKTEILLLKQRLNFLESMNARLSRIIMERRSFIFQLL